MRDCCGQHVSEQSYIVTREYDCLMSGVFNLLKNNKLFRVGGLLRRGI